MPTHYKGRLEEERALSAFINFMRAADSVSARLDGQIEMGGLTHGQFAVLEALFHLGPLNQCDLARKLLRSGGNMTVVLDNLEKRGLVRRERQKEDRRMVVVSLTQPGRKVIAGIFPTHAAAITAEMGRLSPEEQETLRALCRKLGGATGTTNPDFGPAKKTAARVKKRLRSINVTGKRGKEAHHGSDSPQ